MENIAVSSPGLADTFLSTVNSILYYCSIVPNISPSDKLIKAMSSGSGFFYLFLLTNYVFNINKLFIILKLNVMLLEKKNKAIGL